MISQDRFSHCYLSSFAALQLNFPHHFHNPAEVHELQIWQLTPCSLACTLLYVATGELAERGRLLVPLDLHQEH